MSFFKKLKSSKHFPLLNKKKESMSSLIEDLNQRHLIVYHIDSETEGNFSLTVRVSQTIINIHYIQMIVILFSKFLKFTL